ncbi:transporter [Halobacteriales archaeon QS_1_68_20]|nr:MAG: transporter [Halobacteriales archaeon QS_1_68_20]
MSLVDTASLAVHLLVGAVWAGAIAFVVTGVLPLARDGELNAAPLERIAGSLRRLSRVAAVFILATGGHLAGTRYTAESLTSTGNGHLVLTMAGLWFVVTGLVEVGTGKLLDGTGDKEVREPARRATRFLQAAALGGGLILVVGSLLAT